jgi:hypothetical protein
MCYVTNERASQQCFASVPRVYSVSTVNIFVSICDGLRLTIFACHSWEMALSAGLDASFDNMQDRKGTREKAGEVNSTKAYVTDDEACR